MPELNFFDSLAIEIKKQVQAIGADLVGIAGIDSPLLREHGEEPEKLLPGAQSLISIGVALNRAAVCSLPSPEPL